MMIVAVLMLLFATTNCGVRSRPSIIRSRHKRRTLSESILTGQVDLFKTYWEHGTLTLRADKKLVLQIEGKAAEVIPLDHVERVSVGTEETKQYLKPGEFSLDFKFGVTNEKYFINMYTFAPVTLDAYEWQRIISEQMQN